MGQKIRPDSLRLGIIRDWSSRWFTSKKNRKIWLEEDVMFRRIIKEKIGQAGIIKVDIERTSDQYRLFIKAARPGLIIGRGGKGIEELTKALEKSLIKLHEREKDKKPVRLSVNVEELKRSEISAQNVAQTIAWDIEKRVKFRKAMKRHLELMMQNKECLGAKVRLSGRLDGNEISRTEWLAKGKIPLQTLRANIDFGTASAFASYGVVGVKVWIYKGEVFGEDKIR